MVEYFVRFCIGGIAVSAFAILGDICRPKSFAGLFGAAPSIALSTLALAQFKQGSAYVAMEGRSMIVGAIIMYVYCLVVCHLLKRERWSALRASTTALIGWLALAACANWILFR